MRTCILILLAFAALTSHAAEPSFRNQVQPILAKYGCSSGACHGAAAGQGGFKLSLLGYDNLGDHASITRAANGRRIVYDAPERSLLLLKATKTLPHKGGEKIKAGSAEYQILADWIAHGAPGPRVEDPLVERLVITPAHATLKPGAELPLKVTAIFQDGTQQDVTRWAKYTAGDTTVSTVSDTGLVKVTGHGEGSVTAWYLSRLSISTITVPYQHAAKSEAFAAFKPKNFVDQLVLDKLTELNLPPSGTCDDAEFLRRSFLDTLGILPTVDEVRSFLADRSPNKRDQLIDRLLKRPEFTDYWAYKWSDLLLVQSNKLAVTPMFSYYQWIRRNVELNTPWDVMVRDLVTATGSNFENGATNFFTLHDEPTKLAENVSVAFLGMAITCAKCHNHPMEKWTNDQYYAFANLFSRVRSKNGSQADERVIFADTTGDVIQPLTGKPQAPAPLDATPISLTDTQDRRAVLAAWLTAPSNPYFARSITNRVWANFFGTGLVEAVDDLRMTNPASNEKLLSAAAKHLVDQRFDLKALMRTILQSATYQRSSIPLPENESDRRFYTRYYPRRLMAEVLLDAISQVTAVPTSFNVERRNANRGLGTAYPIGYRAIQLPDTNTRSAFLNGFGRPERVQTCECERTNDPSMAQALHMANGDTINEKLKMKQGRVDHLLGSGKPPTQMIEEAYLASLCRLPTQAEATGMAEALASPSTPEGKREVMQDILWSLLSSREFTFNH
jgi:hypothetical protein